MVRRGSDRIFNFVVYIILGLAGLICLFPMMYVIAVSLTPYNEYLRQGGVVFIPHEITLQAYKEFWSEPYLAQCVEVTVFITIVGTLINVALTVLTAYPLAKKDLVFKKFFSLFVLIPMLISGGMIPGYLVVKNIGLYDSVWAYIIPGLIVSYNLMLTRTFFSQIDSALPEAARIDGAGEIGILVRIILPVSKPILATIALMYGVGHWNEYFRSVMYIKSPELRTLQAVLKEVLNRSTDLAEEIIVPSRTLQMAGVMFAAVPIIVVYPFLQKYFTQGMLLGSIKG